MSDQMKTTISAAVAWRRASSSSPSVLTSKATPVPNPVQQTMVVANAATPFGRA
jgi:hypothetical protein